MHKEEFYFAVTDIKQYGYCPRIIYFTYVQPVPRKITRLMEYGVMEHLKLEELEPRRVIKKYGLTAGKKVFREKFASSTLKLSGMLDLSIHTDGAIYPVEFKFTAAETIQYNHRAQLGAYALLLEEKYGIKITTGFIFLSAGKKIIPVALSERDKLKVVGYIREMSDIIHKETFPAMTRNRGKCVDCEWKNFCGDIPLPARPKPVIGCFE